MWRGCYNLGLEYNRVGRELFILHKAQISQINFSFISLKQSIPFVHQVYKFLVFT
ncbi:hypothetical protein WH47_09609 [Habropoda laboriosa]|uniref:Uncharacterized protein n=1 Tax=Habropoda laboriosa TaxID=597456 RepID=A0A0L7RDI9_9HYME|nr:hypothetical protein WH47_09609 [Habropoda laboriosa]